MVRSNAGKDSSSFILLLVGAGVFYLVWQTLGKSNVTTGAAATANILPGNIDHHNRTDNNELPWRSGMSGK